MAGRALILVLGLASQAAFAQSSFPRITFAGEQTLPVYSVPLSEAPGELRATYRVKLDRRLVGAVGEMHQMASGRPAGSVLATLGARGWTLRYGADTVGTVAELPGFRDVERVLGAWAAQLLRRYPLAAGASTSGDAGDLSLPVVAQGLQAVGRQWATRHDAALLRLGARGLTLLALQLPRQSEVGDPLAARALAAVLLAAAAGQNVAAERVLLAYHLGYTGDAAAMALALPADDPVRHFAVGDTLRLRRAAEQAGAGQLIRYLYLLKLVDTGEPDRWRRWQRRQSFEPDFHSGILGAALDFTSSEVDRSLTELVPQQLFLETARLGGVDVLSQGADSAAAWNRLFGGRTLGDRSALLVRFEADIESLGQRFSGSFLDSHALAVYLRAQLHAAFERSCIYAASGRARCAQSCAQRPDGLWATTVGWCRHRARSMAGEDPVAALLSDIAGPSSAVSDEALEGTLEDLQERIRYSDSTDVLVARRYFQRLDSRPSHVYRAGIIAEELLYDVPLKERFYGRLLELAPAGHPYLRTWWARYWENAGTLRVMARDPGARRSDRLFAIRALQSTGDSAAARAAFSQLAAEHPGDWALWREFIEMLEAGHRYEDAARVARRWLERHPGQDRVLATTALARQLQRLGRPQEGWQMLAPLLGRNNPLGLIQRSALIANALGETAKAESLARTIVTRFPESPHARITLAEVLWGQQRDAEVPAVLNEPQNLLNAGEWRDPIAPAFVRVFGRGPVGRARAAFEALVAAGIPRNKLEGVPEEAADSGRYELAVTLHELLPAPSGRTDQIEAWVDAYRYWKRWKGEAAAVGWLRQRWSGGAPVGASVVFYREQEFDLLWTVTAQPDQGADGSYLWVLRVLAAVQQPLSPDRRAQLMAHFQGPSRRFYDIAGRYLLGLEPEGALLAGTNDLHRRCEASYYAGVRALAERRYADASNWFRVTVETPGTEDWEWLYAKDLLFRWSGEHRALPIAVRKVAARR